MTCGKLYKEMKMLDKKTIDGVLTLVEPKSRIPLVFDSPHSGTQYPDDFRFACDFGVLEKAEDKFVDDLFSSAPDCGAALLLAEFPRSYIDTNRCEKDIDPDLLDDLWPHEIATTARSHAGIGLIRRLVRPGLPVYDRQLTIPEIQHRINAYYRPYHDALERVIEKTHYDFGSVWHVNCHSMPSPENQTFRANPLRAADFVLGDRDGTTCDIDFTHSIKDFLKGLGYKVAINDPYKGVELVRRYCAPATGRHSIQIEISRKLYLDEDTYKKSSNYKTLKDDIEKLVKFCGTYVEAQRLPMAAD